MLAAKRPRVKDSELSVYLHDYTSARDAHRTAHLRYIRNRQAYTNDLVSQRLQNNLEKEGRDVQNFPILHHIVRGHLGNIFVNWFDPKWTAREGDPIDAVEALHKVYLANKELYDYKASVYSCLQEGYASGCGVEGLIVDRPTPDPRTWGLKFVSYSPELVDFDPNVYSDQVSRDSKQAWITGFISPKRMLETYNAAHDDILRSLARDEERGQEFEEITRTTFADLDKAKLGKNERVVEWMHIENELETKQFLTNGRLLGERLPDTGYRINSAEDIAMKQQWATQRGFVLTDDMVTTVRNFSPVMYTTTFCPSLGILLENRKDYRQLNGHLPLYAWSFMQMKGMFWGLIDYGWDIQQDFNKRRLAKTKWLTQTPGDKPFVRRDMFEGDENALREFIQQWPDPGTPAVLPEGAGVQGQDFGIMNGTQIPTGIFQEEQFLPDFADRILMLPAVLQGRGDRLADSGVAIGRKVVEGQVMQRPESDSVIQHENHKAEDWTILAIKLYGHPSQRNRKFNSGEGNEIVINEVVDYDPVGSPILRRNIGALKRPRVTISQSRENDYMAQIRRELANGALMAMQPSDTNMLNRAALEYLMVTNMDYANDADKEMAKKLATMQLEIVTRKGEQELQALSGQPQPGPGVPPGANGGAPQGGPPPSGPAAPPSSGPRPPAPPPEERPGA